MSSLLTADIHLTTNPREEERWGLIPWLVTEGLGMRCSELLILGDLTEAKDRHPAMLVNRLVDQLIEAAKRLRVIVLLGNHDYYDKAHPFFGFLSKLPSESGITFVAKPTPITISPGPSIFLPSTDDWEQDWSPFFDFSQYDYAFAHQTFEGIIADNGFQLPGGIPAGTLDGVRKRAFSGDIHTHQRFGQKGEYVGAPYHIDFGDQYEPRCLVIGTAMNGTHQQQNLVFPTKGKYVINTRDVGRLRHHKVPQGAEVKIRVSVSKADLPMWQETKAKAKANAERQGWIVKDVELVRTEPADAVDAAVPKVQAAHKPAEIFRKYCADKAAPGGVAEMGIGLLEDRPLEP